MNLENKASIKAELEKILTDEHPEWVQVGLVLTAVKKSRYWSQEYSSFSKWLEEWGKQVNLGKATLWRYITAQTKYNRLRSEANESGYSLPKIEESKQPISPEGIEIFDKLSRVLEDNEVFEMMKGFVEGKITRKELREKWSIYKPALDGLTARGRTEVSPIKIDPSDKKQQGHIIESIVMDALRVSGSKWLCKTDPVFFKFFQNVKPDYMHSSKRNIILDAVLAIKESAKEPLYIHGFDVRAGVLRETELIKIYRKYCNVLWIAMLSEHAKNNIHLIPDGVGLIAINNKKVEILIHAKLDEAPELSELMLKGLLTRWVSA